MVVADAIRLRYTFIHDHIALLGWEYATGRAKRIDWVSYQRHDSFCFADSQAPLDCVLGQQFTSKGK
jgi:hypothetical protein